MNHQRPPNYSAPPPPPQQRQNHYLPRGGHTGIPPPGEIASGHSNAGFTMPNFNFPPPSLPPAMTRPPPPAPYYARERPERSHSPNTSSYHSSSQQHAYKRHPPPYKGTGGSQYPPQGRRYGSPSNNPVPSNTSGGTGYKHPGHSYSSAGHKTASYTRPSAPSRYAPSGRSHSVPSNTDRLGRPPRTDRSASCRRDSDSNSSSSERASSRHSRFKVVSH